MVAAAVVGSAVVGAYAANKAGSKQADAANRATDISNEQYYQTREDYAPWREAGKTTLGQLVAGTADGADFNRDFSLTDFQQDPGYQFRMREGMRGLEGSAAARGNLLSGGTLKALERYSQDFASGEYQNAYNRFNADRDRRFNRLSSIAGLGQTATRDVASFGQNASTTAGNNLMGAANARASGYIGTANSLNQGIGNYITLSYLGKTGGAAPVQGITGGGMASDAAAYYPSDIRLKTDIRPLGMASNGLPVYAYRYLWGKAEHIGHMAHEVEAKFPDAVIKTADGFKLVNYAKVNAHAH